MSKPEDEWIGGVRAVLESLDASPERILELYIARRASDHAVEKAIDKARRAGVKVRRVRRGDLDAHLPYVNHQGLAIRRGVVGYADLEATITPSATPALLVALDEVTDPRNVGAILRSAWAFGVGGVLIPRHRAAGLTAAAVKTAAGATEHIPVFRTRNVAQALDYLKGLGYWIFGADGSAETPLSDLDFSSPTVLVMGAEGKGLRPAVRKACDLLFRIPMETGAQSLNVSVAAGIALARAYEFGQS